MVVATFFKAALGNIEKAEFICLAQFLISLGNIRLYRYCGTTELRCQPEFLVFREVTSYPVG
mgnify:CR=1 FL=1